jgi:hypothetical protein
MLCITAQPNNLGHQRKSALVPGTFVYPPKPDLDRTFGFGPNSEERGRKLKNGLRRGLFITGACQPRLQVSPTRRRVSAKGPYAPRSHLYRPVVGMPRLFGAVRSDDFRAWPYCSAKPGPKGPDRSETRGFLELFVGVVEISNGTLSVARQLALALNL